MGKIRGKEQQYADEAFRREIRSRQGYYNLMSQQALADAADIPRPTLRKRLLDPAGMSVEELRRLIKTIKPSADVVLSLLGYSGKDLKSLPVEAED